MTNEIYDKLEDIQWKASENTVFYKDKLISLNMHRKLLLGANTIIPIISLIALYLSKKEKYEATVSTISFFVSMALFILTIISIIFKVDENVANYNKYINSNCEIKDKAEKFQKGILTEDSLNYFFDEVTVLHSKDIQRVSYKSNKQRQKLYRDAIMLFCPDDAKCEECGNGVWAINRKGVNTCNVCGNKK